MLAKSIVAKSEKDFKDQISHLIKEEFKPTLAIIFSGHEMDLKEISSFLIDSEIKFCGCTTAGEIADAEKYDKQIVSLLLDIDPSYFKIYHEEYKDDDEIAVIRRISEKASDDYNKPAFIVLNSGVNRDGEKIVQGIKENTSIETKIFGGMAGDGGYFSETLNFSDDGVFNDAFLALVLDNEKIRIEGVAVSGWDGQGGTFTITKAVGNKLYKINDIDALDFFLDHFGLDNFYDEDRDNLVSIPGNFPLKLRSKGGFERLRSIMNYDKENKALLLAGGVEEGQAFEFCLPPSINVLDNAVSKFQTIGEKIPKVDALVLISCMARKVVFGPLILKELEGIKKIWNSPLVGFFAYGELGRTHDEDYCNFHNCTSSLVTLTEI